MYEFDDVKSSTLRNFDEKIIYVCCGWNFNVIMTLSLKLYYWPYRLKDSKMIRFRPIELKTSEFTDEHVLKICCGDGFVLSLTNNNSVFIWVIEDASTYYDIHSITNNIDIDQLLLEPINENIQCKILQESIGIKIIHINAQFNQVALIQSNKKVILLRKDENFKGIFTKQIEEVFKSIQVCFGDWHGLSLDDFGVVKSWGNHSLGYKTQTRNDGDRVSEIPYFLNRYFVFYIAAAGWHSCALALDLSPDLPVIYPNELESNHNSPYVIPLLNRFEN